MLGECFISIFFDVNERVLAGEDASMFNHGFVSFRVERERENFVI